VILSDFILFSRQNKILIESGIDSRQYCKDQKYFDTHPHTVEYRYNSRGFRDNEWPDSIEELKNCIWCFGDSFTVGLGSPIEHTWVNILQQKTGIRCINVSMDGASNAWIARKINRVSDEINPRLIIVQWSYLHRTENKNISLSDEDRRIAYSDNISINYQFDNFKNLQGSINNKSAQIVESIIPNALPIYHHNQYKEKINILKGTDWPELIDITLDGFTAIDKSIKKELKNFGILTSIIEYLKYKHLIDTVDCIFVEQIDFARDGHHYDYLTAGKFVDSIMERISTFSS
jgi:hypothetical protein